MIKLSIFIISLISHSLISFYKLIIKCYLIIALQIFSLHNLYEIKTFKYKWVIGKFANPKQVWHHIAKRILHPLCDAMESIDWIISQHCWRSETSDGFKWWFLADLFLTIFVYLHFCSIFVYVKKFKECANSGEFAHSVSSSLASKL